MYSSYFVDPLAFFSVVLFQPLFAIRSCMHVCFGQEADSFPYHFSCVDNFISVSPTCISIYKNAVSFEFFAMKCIYIFPKLSD